MEFVDIVAGLAVLQFFLFGFQTGGARGKYKVPAPAVTGNEIFERYFRVQQNTLEQLVIFLPALYLFSRYVSPRWAGMLGVVYLVGRQVYAVTYVKNPAKRGAGFMIGIIPVAVLLFGALGVAIVKLFQ